MAERITRKDMIRELERMLSPRVRSGAEIDRRTRVFRAIIAFLESAAGRAALANAPDPLAEIGEG